MLNIRPITDLRNNFAEISKTVHEDNQPVILTKNGYGDMVVMSLERYESLVRDAVIDAMLRESAREALSTDERYSFDEVAAQLRQSMAEKSDGADEI